MHIFISLDRKITRDLPDVNTHQAVLAKPIQLIALLKQSETCAKASSEQVLLSNNVFAETRLSQLCELHLQTNKSIVQLLLVARDSYTVLSLTKSQQGWQTPRLKTAYQTAVIL